MAQIPRRRALGGRLRVNPEVPIEQQCAGYQVRLRGVEREITSLSRDELLAALKQHIDVLEEVDVIHTRLGEYMDDFRMGTAPRRMVDRSPPEF